MAADTGGQRKARRETRRVATLMQVSAVQSRRVAEELTLPLLGESVRKRPKGFVRSARQAPRRSTPSVGYGPPSLRGSISASLGSESVVKHNISASEWLGNEPRRDWSDPLDE